METRFRYEDSLRRVNTDVRTNALSVAIATWSVRGQAEFDGFGRDVFGRKFVPNGIGGTDTIETAKSYDEAGRAWRTSNPQIGGLTQWTAESYFDGLDRTIRTRQMGDDGLWAETKTDYLGQAVEVTEAGGRRRRSEMDALGRTAVVVEAPGEAGFGFTSSYTYDSLDRLLGVQQVGQTRSFSFDSLGRMRTALNPERGSTAESYEYDDNGNVSSQTDARNVLVTMVYDSLNRVTRRTYSTSPANANIVPSTEENFSYDLCANGKGKVCTAGNGAGSRGYSYDTMGRVKTAQQGMTGAPGSPYNFSYDYTATGQLDKITYPSMRVVQHGYDAGDRLNSVASGTVSASIAKYHPQGTPEEIVFGNGVKETWGLNRRLQVGSMVAARAGTALLSLGYGYGTSADNNGNVRTQTITAGGAVFAQSYGYDRVNRLEGASETTTVAGASGWSVNYQYDRYGNMAAGGWSLAVPAGMATSLQQYNPGTNRRDRTTAGAALGVNPYDAAGNVVSDGALGEMKYDQAGRLRETQVLGKTITYDYDAEGRRVKRVFGGATYYVYDGAGQLAAEYGAGEGMSCTVCYLTVDALGSTRLMTDGSGAVKQRTDYLPFGDMIAASATQGGGRQTVMDGQAQTTYAWAGGPTQKFTGKERDAETGLDYFGARYFSGAQGRMTSPDAPFADQLAADPQSWNLYAYARNNPLKFVDPTGLNSSNVQTNFLHSVSFPIFP